MAKLSASVNKKVTFDLQEENKEKKKKTPAYKKQLSGGFADLNFDDVVEESPEKEE